jgi:hypothetical protein
MMPQTHLHRLRRTFACGALCLAWWLAGVGVQVGRADDLRESVSPPGETRAGVPSHAAETARRLSALEAQLDRVTAENQRLARELEELQPRSALSQAAVTQTALPESAAPQLPPDPGEGESVWPAEGAPSLPASAGWWPDGADRSLFSSEGWHTGYDHGFVIVPAPGNDSPFSLKITNQAMFRYSGFLAEEESWVNSAGISNPIDSASNFQIPRGRLSFAGGALVPSLGYQLTLDYNTVSSDPIGFRAYILSYEFSEALVVHVGQNKVPGSREWLTSAFQVQGPDRSLATTFFRPSLSQGVWFTGTGFERVHYHLMVSNGFNTSNIAARELNLSPCYSGSVWWEPWGAFGKDASDLQWHDQPAIRLGTSQTFAADRGSQSSSGAPENSLLRLSDGTVITDAGALAPGVTLTDYTVLLSAFDVGYKYRGLSLLGELYLQTLGNLRGTGPLPLSSTHALGGYLQGGVFVLPREFELYGRGSVVAGDYGTGGEYAGGWNWFPIAGRDSLRVTTDLAYILRSPADQNRTNYVAGATGWLLRAQISTSF